MIEELVKKYTSTFETVYGGNEVLVDKAIERLAKSNNVDKDELQKAMRKSIKERKYGKQKGKIKFYHSTSLSSAEKIILDKALMSYKERKKRNEEINNSGANTKDHGVQFTNDEYNFTGEFYSTGYAQGRGAKGMNITFVFGDELLEDPLFDAFDMYPSIDYISLDKCLAIICTDVEEKKVIIDLLNKNNLSNILVYTKDEFDVKIPSTELKRQKELNEILDSNTSIIDETQNTK
jgi:hypothetical protein